MGTIFRLEHLNATYAETPLPDVCLATVVQSVQTASLDFILTLLATSVKLVKKIWLDVIYAPPVVYVSTVK